MFYYLHRSNLYFAMFVVVSIRSLVIMPRAQPSGCNKVGTVWKFCNQIYQVLDSAEKWVRRRLVKTKSIHCEPHKKLAIAVLLEKLAKTERERIRFCWCSPPGWESNVHHIDRYRRGIRKLVSGKINMSSIVRYYKEPNRYFFSHFFFFSVELPWTLRPCRS